MNKKKCFVFMLSGGIGNQLFQYSAGQFLAQNKSFLVRYQIDSQGKFHAGSDIRELVDLYETIPSITSQHQIPKFIRRIHNISGRRIQLYQKFSKRFSLGYFSPVVGYDPHLEKLDKSNKVYGYFQSQVYAEVVRKKILDNFAARIKSDELASLLKLSQVFDPVMVHIRRGDYLSQRSNIGLLSYEYFENAIKQALKNNESRKIWVFTDSTKEATNLLSNRKIKIDKIFGENDGLDYVDTLVLMASANNIVISNSTYSWWAAFLGSDKNKVFYPNPWYRGIESPQKLIPTNWHPVDSLWS